MTQLSLRPPPNLQPRPKAVPTFSSTSIAAGSTTTPPQTSRHPSRSCQPSPTRSLGRSNPSGRATAALIRRVLCPHSHGASDSRPVHELLPPLTSSNDVDFQLYAIIAIVVKDLVQSWYGKITPDQGFVEEVIKIVAHCTTQLESRLRIVNLESLVLDEIPTLISHHIHAYRISHQSSFSPLSTDPQVIYHDLNPHPALSPVPTPSVPASVTEQKEHEAEYRQLLVQGALAILLPTEDLENACLRTLVADVIADSILGNSIGGKMCEGWLIWDSVIKLVKVVKANLEPKAMGEEIEVDSRSRLEKFGLLADQSKDERTNNQIRRSAFSSYFWRILQYCYLAFVSLRLIAQGFNAAYSQPLRSVSLCRRSTSAESSLVEKRDVESHHRIRPISDFGIFPLISTILNLPSRMPWLSGCLALFQHQLIHGPLRVGATDGILDLYLHHLLTTQVHPPTLLPSLLRLTRHSLFPHSTLPPPSPPPPSHAEALQLKRQCAVEILSLLPPSVCRRFFGTSGEGEDAEKEREVWISSVERDFLDVWGDAYMNRHLAYAVLELCVVRCLPELGEKGVQGLMGERVGGS